MLGLKLNHVSKRGHCSKDKPLLWSQSQSKYLDCNKMIVVHRITQRLKPIWIDLPRRILPLIIVKRSHYGENRVSMGASPETERPLKRRHSRLKLCWILSCWKPLVQPATARLTIAPLQWVTVMPNITVSKYHNITQENILHILSLYPIPVTVNCYLDKMAGILHTFQFHIIICKLYFKFHWILFTMIQSITVNSKNTFFKLAVKTHPTPHLHAPPPLPPQKPNHPPTHRHTHPPTDTPTDTHLVPHICFGKLGQHWFK